MQGAGLHEETDLPSFRSDSALAGVATVVGLASRYEAWAAEGAELNACFAGLVRDGGADALPAQSAREVMSAIGAGHHEAQVAAGLGLAQMEQTSAHLDDGVRSSPGWVERHCGMSSGTVAELRRLGRCFDRYPEIAGAFIQGRLRSAELVAVDKIIPSRFSSQAKRDAIAFLADVEDQLIAGAEACVTPLEFARFCKGVRARIDGDGEKPKVRGDSDSEVRLKERSDGWFDLVGLLNPDDGAIASTLLDEKALKNLRSRNDDPELNGVKDDRTADARRAEALMQLLLAGVADGRPGRVGLYIHMGLGDLVGLGAEEPTPKARTMANYDISEETLWALLADADVTPIITENGTPLSYGRTRRLAPHMLRMALAFRDDTCWIPGCDAGPASHHVHHVEWWENGGNTDPTDTRGGCGFHDL
jgi:hypothetical protein